MVKILKEKLVESNVEKLVLNPNIASLKEHGHKNNQKPKIDKDTSTGH